MVVNGVAPVWKASDVFDPGLQIVCGSDRDELDATRRALRARLDEAGVHPAISREMMLAFTEITTPRADYPPEAKVTADLEIGDDELVLRVQLSAALVADARQSGEQDLMLHLLGDKVSRVDDADHGTVVTVTKRRLGR